MPVAITGVGGADYLIADYVHVFLFNAHSGSLKLLQIDMGGIISKFEPTAFAIDAENDRIFIANYHGNNILIGRLDKERNSLKIVGELGDANTVSPEGVVFNGSLLATANYDGSNVQVFEPSGEGWSTRCDIPVKQAHGIAFLGRYIYARSLWYRQVIRIDPESCAVVGRTGGRGWKRGQYLWPTFIAPWDDKSIAITDAHTGMISVVDARTLSVTRTFGGNGPGLDGLNMPYAISVEGENVLVTNTFGSRIVAFNKESGGMTDVWAAKPIWPGVAYEYRYSIAAERRNTYGTRNDISIKIGGECYHPGYAEMVKCEDRHQSISVGPFNGIYNYMIEAVRTEHGVFLFSSNSPWSLYYDSADDPEHPRQVLLGRDHWLVDGRVIGPDGAVDLDKLLNLPH